MKAVLGVMVLLRLGVIAQADVFNLGQGLTNLETVAVGDPGNAGELSGAGAGGRGPDRICGAVNYDYRIGKYEVTAAQYTDFLNHKAKSDPYGLYRTYMDTAVNFYGCNIKRSGSYGSYSYSVAPEWANRPVNWVSYWDALRFANWLNNDQGNGSTETGAYTLNGYNGTDGRAIARNAGAKWFLPSEDEWYKAAYYKGGATNAGYWDYPTQSNAIPSNQLLDPDPGNNATYYGGYIYTIGSPYYRTEVGAHENSESAYGAFDQGGNIYEWNETLVPGIWAGGDAYRGLRGGSWYNTSIAPHGNWLKGFYRYGYNPTAESIDWGFRVVYIPEPTSLLALASGLLGLGGVCRRRKR